MNSSFLSFFFCLPPFIYFLPLQQIVRTYDASHRVEFPCLVLRTYMESRHQFYLSIPPSLHLISSHLITFRTGMDFGPKKSPYGPDERKVKKSWGKARHRCWIGLFVLIGGEKRRDGIWCFSFGGESVEGSGVEWSGIDWNRGGLGSGSVVGRDGDFGGVFIYLSIHLHCEKNGRGTSNRLCSTYVSRSTL